MLVTQRRVHWHSHIFTCPRSEQGQLLFQVAPSLAGKARDVAIRRTPCIRLMTDFAKRVETASFRFGGCARATPKMAKASMTGNN
jgi:hypothetical protein